MGVYSIRSFQSNLVVRKIQLYVAELDLRLKEPFYEVTTNKLLNPIKSNNKYCFEISQKSKS